MAFDSKSIDKNKGGAWTVNGGGSSEGYSTARRQELVIAAGKIFELVHQEQPDGRIFELARRAPGVRIIIANRDTKKILLTKEYRRELGRHDYRLPGGKVFDTLAEFSEFRESGADITDVVMAKARQEGVEEAGVVIDKMGIIGKSTLGATVEWDLYTVEANEWHIAENGQQLEQGEEIAADEWFSYDDAYRMALEGEMSEERIALSLIRWINEQRRK